MRPLELSGAVICSELDASAASVEKLAASRLHGRNQHPEVQEAVKSWRRRIVAVMESLDYLLHGEDREAK